MALTIKKDRIIDHWAQMINNGAGNAPRLMQMTEALLKEVNVPDVAWGTTEVTTGWMGKKRDFLLVMHNGLREFRMFLGARDFGPHLDCGWFLTVEPGFLKSALSRKFAGSHIALSENLDVFAQMDLNAYASVVHQCFYRAVETLMKELQQDTSGLQAKSKGFLSVW